MRLVFTYLKRYWMVSLLAPLLMFGEVAMDLMQPTLMSRIIDIGIARMDIVEVLRTGLLMILAATAGLAGGIGCGVAATIAAANLARDLRRDLYGKVLSLSHANVDHLETGNIITRSTNDVLQVENMTRMMLRIMVRAPLQVIGSVLMAIIISPSLSLLVFILIPILLALFIVIVRRGYPLFSAVQRRLDGVNVRVQESLSGIRLVKSFNRTDYEKERFAAANDGFMKQNVLASRVVALIQPSTQVLLYLGIAAVLWFGGIQVTGGSLPVGRLLAFISYLTQLLFSLIMTNNLLMQFSRAQASITRIREILDAVPAIPDAPVATVRRDAAVLRGELEFRNVSFGYDGEQVLKSISFRVEPGEFVVILGETGSGKSTLVSLIPRLYDVSSGSVLLDGRDVRDYELDVLRSAIGMAPQEVVLFSGSVEDNIAYGSRSIDRKRVAWSAEVAAVSEFIESLPEGYATDIRRGGVNLSGGQKQRISIARAVAPAPAVRIFDDATSAVDLSTEIAILDAILHERPRVTTLLVAQRITTAMRADKVVLLDRGSVIGIGTHASLLASSRLYQDIHRSQFGERHGE